jgi:hypothetical protein
MMAASPPSRKADDKTADKSVREQMERSKTAQENVKDHYDSSPGLGINRAEPDEERTKSADGAG